MEFGELLEIVGDEPVFETGLLLAGEIKPGEVRRQLSRWVRAGKVYQLRRGLYALAPPYQKVRPHPFLVANRLAAASYVSLQSALAYYGMIPEHVPQTTSITTRRPGSWQTPLGDYAYRHIQVDYFAGFQVLEVAPGQHAYVASPEKAILDLVYLVPGADTADYLRELRPQNLERLDWQELTQLVDQWGKKKLARAARHLRLLAEEDNPSEVL